MAKLAKEFALGVVLFEGESPKQLVHGSFGRDCWGPPNNQNPSDSHMFPCPVANHFDGGFWKDPCALQITELGR